MSIVRLQSRYWEMIHHSIELSKKSLDDKMKQMREQVEDDNVLLYNEEYNNMHSDIMRYEAIDEIIKKAAKKTDIISKGIGPDEPDDTDYESEMSSEEEEKLRWLEQID